MNLLLFRCLWWIMPLVMMLYLPVDEKKQGDKKQSSAESSLFYTLQHPLHTVYGVSDQVSSEIRLSGNGKSIQSVSVTVPVASFNSGNRARDRDMLKATEADQYPEVRFVSSSIEQEQGHLRVTGLLTFHGVTEEISFAARQLWQKDALVVNGEFNISLDAFKVKRPSIFGMKVRDVLLIRYHMVYPAS